MDDSSIALKFHFLIFQQLNGKGRRKAENIMFLTVVDMCWPWHNHKAIKAAMDKEEQQPSGPLPGENNRKWYD